MAEEAIYDILKNGTHVAPLVGDRIYPLVANMATYGGSVFDPYIVFSRESQQDRQYSQVGIAPLNIGTFNTTAVADSYFGGTKLIADAIRLDLGYKSGTFAGVVLQRTELIDEFDSYVQTVGGGERYHFARTLIWKIAFQEAVS